MCPKPFKSLLSELVNTIRCLIKRCDQLLNDLHWITQEINKIDVKAEKFVKQDESKQQVELLTSVPVVGTFTALMLLSYLPELDNINGAQISALVGVAPFNRGF